MGTGLSQSGCFALPLSADDASAMASVGDVEDMSARGYIHGIRGGRRVWRKQVDRLSIQSDHVTL